MTMITIMKSIAIMIMTMIMITIAIAIIITIAIAIIITTAIMIMTIILATIMIMVTMTIMIMMVSVASAKTFKRKKQQIYRNLTQLLLRFYLTHVAQRLRVASASSLIFTYCRLNGRQLTSRPLRAVISPQPHSPKGNVKRPVIIQTTNLSVILLIIISTIWLYINTSLLIKSTV